MIKQKIKRKEPEVILISGQGEKIMKIVINALELGNEKDFSIKGDFQHLVDTGVLQQFVSQLQNKMLDVDQTGMTTLIQNAYEQDSKLLATLPQELRKKLFKTYETLKEKGENDLAENIEALALHFINMEKVIVEQKNHLDFIGSTSRFPQMVNPHSQLYQIPYTGPCGGYDPNYGMIYPQMRSVPEFVTNNYYNISPWQGSPVEQFKMAKFFQDMIVHYLNSLYALEDKDFEVRYYISKTLYEVQRVQGIIMDLYRGNDNFETKRTDLEGIFEIIFYCNKQLRKLRPDDNIMELKKDVFYKFTKDLENTFVQIKK